MKENIKFFQKSAGIIMIFMLILPACKNSGNGELIGVMDRQRTELPTPYGMTYVPSGYYTRGSGGEDPAYSQAYSAKTISISGFYMDETEITNNEYRQFVQYVIDSIKRRLLGDVDPAFVIESEDENIPPMINWNTKIKNTPENNEALEALYTPVNERFHFRKEVDTRKLNYEFYWFDYQSAAVKSWEETDARKDGVNMASFGNRPQSMKSRAGYIKKEIINVYPDTLCWLLDFAYSYNEPMVRSYFSSAMYDHYPVVGVNWKQAKAFCIWRSDMYNNFLESKGMPTTENFRLPTEAEWEYAARGGLDLSPYPWGGPYAMNANGCLLGNFKPQRGKYALDGGVYPVIVGHYSPNDFGLYDMMGNVAEWCIDAYDETYDGQHDLNPVFEYNAKDDDKIARKRKVVRGGSFKDFAEFTKVYTRDYEYQDTAKSNIGFRCVMSYTGRNKGDNMSAASNVYKN